MPTAKKLALLFVATLLLLLSCEKVDNLSDSVSLTDFKLLSHTPTDIELGEPYINADTIHIPVLSGFPLSISVEPIADSNTEKILMGTSFSSFDDIVFQPCDIAPKTFYLIAKSGLAKPYHIKLDISEQNPRCNFNQLPNAEFEIWKLEGTYPTIDETPGIALGWATANNGFIQGTMPTLNSPNGYAAEMTTDILNNLLIKNLITSGTLFVGEFKLSLDMNNPRSMMRFGIPFEHSPTAVAIDAKYQPGNKLQKSVLVSGMTYSLEDVAGQDVGQIWVELVNWSGNGNISYNGEANANVKVLARGEYNFVGASDWTRITIPFVKNAIYDQYPVTHIVVVMASSYEGHLFLGAKGSKLTVDNIELVYP